MAFAYGCIKASIVCFCRRLFVAHKGSPFDWASGILLGIIVLWSVGFLMAQIVGCGKQVELHWAPLQVVMASGCDVSTPEIAMVISDVVLDVLIVILPLPAVRNSFTPDSNQDASIDRT